MITKVQGEAPFQVLTNNFSISPSSQGYTLQISADGKAFSNLFTVTPNTTRMVSNVAANSYYRLLGNQSEVLVNWMKTCVTEGGGGGNAGELEPVTEFPVGAAEGTVVSLVSGDTMGLYQYDGENWNEVVGGDLTNYYTKSETDAKIDEVTDMMQEKEEVIAAALVDLKENGGNNVVELTRAQYEALVDPDPDTLYIITDADAVDLNDYAPASGLTELSGTVATINSNYATKQNVTARSSGYYWPRWNSQGVITGEYRYYVKEQGINGSNYSVIADSSTNHPSIFAPTSAGTAGQPLLSNGSGAPVWGGYKFAFISQSQYDALTTKDATTIYFVVDPS